tara:strand:- start:678 stop:1931 length:1254 start_codon:yes stop_codon:yes gene_type:complete
MHNEYKLFLKIFYYPIVLLPFFLITGPLLPDLIVTLSGLTFLAISIKNKNYVYFNNFFFKYFIFIYLFISFLYFFYDEKNIYYLIKPLTMIRFLLFVAALSYLIRYKKSFVDLLFKVIIFCYLGLFIDSIIQLSFDRNIFNYELSNTGRVSSFFKDELVLGSYVLRFFPILISIIFYRNYIKKNLILSTSILICSTLILLSGERTSLILFFIFITLFILISSDFIKKKFIFLISIFLILFSVISLNSSFKTRFIDNVLFFLKGENSDKKLKIISDEHQGVFFSAYDIFLKNPIIGTGVNSFRRVCKNVTYNKNNKFFDKFKCSSHPHNIYLQLLSETGFLPFFMFISIFFYFIIKLFQILIKKIDVKNYNLSLYISFIITLFPLAPSGNMFNNWMNVMYFLPVAIYLGLNQNVNKKT